MTDSWSAIDEAADPDEFIGYLDRFADEPETQRRKARMRELLAAEPDELIVDVGCGLADDAAAVGGIGVDNSITLLVAARERRSATPLVGADARRLPLASGSINGVIADRVLQHLDRAGDALAEWRRVLVGGGRLVTCDPDHTTTHINGVGNASDALKWRLSMRPGRDVVAHIADELRRAGFNNIHVERHALVLRSLQQHEGVFGLASWGEFFGDAGWRQKVEDADRRGRLEYRCDYVVAYGAA